MNVKEYLKEKQPVVYQVLANSFSNNKTSHAYIVSGSKGSPTLEVATFMAQSLVCSNPDENGLACECCNNCEKIKKKGYADFIFYNGEDLKQQATLEIQEEFSKSSIEKEGKKIYIINQIEKAPIASLNKLLKFIEEPTSNIVAIFTSNSVDAILPTIVSRCQVINLKEFMVKDLVAYLMANGVKEEDAYLVSKISNNAEANLALINGEKYPIIKDILEKTLAFLANSKDSLIVYFEQEALKKFENNQEIEVYLDMLESCLLEAIIKKEDATYIANFFDELIGKIAESCKRIDWMIKDITNAKIELLSNANKNLAFDKLLINLGRR